LIGVVEASALVRLFVPDGPLPDGFEEFLRGVERGMNKAIAPELLVAEMANVIVKKRKRGELRDDESVVLLSDLLSVPVRLLPHSPILSKAFELAWEHNLTVYDTLYLALAEARGAVLFTADDRLLKVAERLNLV
jgi:predicted nucleic acid-binding protein